MFDHADAVTVGLPLPPENARLLPIEELQLVPQSVLPDVVQVISARATTLTAKPPAKAAAAIRIRPVLDISDIK